jgi:hypothetical protein
MALQSLPIEQIPSACGIVAERGVKRVALWMWMMLAAEGIYMSPFLRSFYFSFSIDSRSQNTTFVIDTLQSFFATALVV